MDLIESMKNKISLQEEKNMAIFLGKNFNISIVNAVELIEVICLENYN